MFKIWLARHGEAVDPERAKSDFDRCLTDVGRRTLTETARWLMKREAPPDLILHSPLVRARQTAETLAAEVGQPPVQVENRLAPGVNTSELLHFLATTTIERVVCVGHQPDMSRCLAEMIGGGHVNYSPGTIAGIEFHGPIVLGGGQLRWISDPRWFL